MHSLTAFNANVLFSIAALRMISDMVEQSIIFTKQFVANIARELLFVHSHLVLISFVRSFEINRTKFAFVHEATIGA